MRVLLFLAVITAALGQIPDSTGGGGSGTLGADIDFTSKTTTKPIKAGTSLPATCSASELFIDTDITPAGTGIYQCTSTNTWTQLIVDGIDGPTTYTSATTWTRTGANHGLGTCALVVLLEMEIGTNWRQVYAPAPCASATYDVVASFGAATAGRMTLYKVGGGGGSGGLPSTGGTGIVAQTGTEATAARTITGTTGTVTVTNGNGVSGNPTLTIAAALDLSSNTSSIPWPSGSSLPGTCSVGQSYYKTSATIGLYHCSATNTWTQSCVSAAGTGMSATGCTVSVDTATVPTFLTATASLDFPSTAVGVCNELTITLTGAATGDAVAPRWPATLEVGFLGNMFVSATNTVTVRLCKIATGTVDPANQTFGATIVRSF